ncbi:hypothetical protein HYH03_016606 [Edaphochlamys debaryana]|uniref:Protein kinase domain-containing protein n=1 Tax=Edaphochlamys debaryana TaxID=47281 RepID=A0A835XIE7_9CHLO|nr:hypothetical protein HYH03_016606 [Edaphochlamys debaryana]|eukprot:KAG2484653.1 hypothetical protein HYH03_016606 [Edaphochlamys debaryana]
MPANACTRDLVAVRVLGEGAYAEVFECLHRPSGTALAVKRFKYAHVEPQARRLALRELRVLRALSPHPNIVMLHGSFQSKSGHIYMTFEKMAGGDMHQEMQRHPDQRLPPSLLRCAAFQLLSALDHCHQHGVVHRDVKPANVLIDHRPAQPPPASPTGADPRATPGALVPVVKLCDMGLARWLPGCEPAAELAAQGAGRRAGSSGMTNLAAADSLTSYCVTRWYRAPELLQGGHTYGPGVDVWAYGATLAEWATGLPLFPGATELDQLWLVSQCLGPQAGAGRTAPTLQPVPETGPGDPAQAPCAASAASSGPGASPGLLGRLMDVDPGLVQLIRLCLTLDPAARPSAAQLLRLPYFASAGLEPHSSPEPALGGRPQQQPLSPERPSTAAAPTPAGAMCMNAVAAGTTAARKLQLPRPAKLSQALLLPFVTTDASPFVAATASSGSSRCTAAGSQASAPTDYSALLTPEYSSADARVASVASGYGPGFNPNPLAPLFGLSGSSGAAGSSWAWLQSPQPPPPAVATEAPAGPAVCGQEERGGGAGSAAPRVPRLTRMLRGLVSVNCYSGAALAVAAPSLAPPPAMPSSGFARSSVPLRPLPVRPVGQRASRLSLDSVLPVRTGSSCGSGSQASGTTGVSSLAAGGCRSGSSTCAARSGSSGQVALSVGVRSAIAAFFEGEDAAVEEAQGCGEADGADEAAADTRRPLTKAAMPAVAEEGSLMNTAAEVWVGKDTPAAADLGGSQARTLVTSQGGAEAPRGLAAMRLCAKALARRAKALVRAVSTR